MLANGFNRWKTWVYQSVPVNSQPWTARCGDHYDPQLVKRSSEGVYREIQLHRVSKNKQNYFFITTSNFHQIRQFLAQRWQTYKSAK